jgi:hypothetical protein
MYVSKLEKGRVAMNFDRIFGMLCIIFGACIALWALGEFLLRTCIAILGLFIVNFGLKLRSMPSLYITLMRLWSSRYDF